MWLRLRGFVALALVALVGALAGIALASCGGDDGGETTDATQPETTQTPTTTPTTTTEVGQPPVVRIRVVGGTPKGGIVRTSVKKGDPVVLVITSDVADEVHLHGYDISREVAAGGTVRLRFRAKLPGRFELELEDRGIPIADLTVEP